MKRITYLFLLAFSVSFAQTFTDVTGSLPQLTFSMAAWGDYDGDGDMDLFYTGYLNANNPGGGGLYQNDNGTFNLVAGSGLPQYDLGAADWGDVDGDGDVDLLISGYDDPSSTAHADVYINNGNGTFTAANSGIMGIYMGDAQLVDVNNDGKEDIAISGMETTGWTFITKIYLNGGNGTTFTEITTALPGMNYGRFAFGDYDNDGNIDFVLNGWKDTTNNPYTQLWKNNGDNTFTEQTIAFAQLWLGDMEFGDYDNDGDLDLITSGTSSSDSEIHLYDNNGDGTFTENIHISNIVLVHQSEIEWADFNQDGHLDLFIMGRHYDASSEFLSSNLYMGNGSVFNENTNTTFGAAIYGNVKVADYDSDGQPDIFLCGNDSGSFGLGRLYHNDGTSSITEAIQNHFSVYPNPAHNFVKVSSEYPDDFEVTITDLTGKEIINRNNIKTQKTINLSGLTRGIYLIKVTEKDKSFVQKLIIK